MKIESKTLMVSTKHNLVLAKGNITLSVIHQVYLSEDKDGGVMLDIDLCDYEDIKFMDMEISNTKEFITHLKGLGIDFKTLVDDACVGIFSTQDIKDLKSLYIP